MNHCAVALGLQASLNATHLPLAQVKESRGLALCPLAQEHAVHNRQDVSLVLTHLDPALHQALLGVVP
jgi:transposase